MNFNDASAFCEVFGPSMTARELSQVVGIALSSAARLAQDCGVTLLRESTRIPGLEHLPGLPDFATTKAWAGGTWYRIDCEKAGDSPGYRSLLIHQSKRRGDDAPETDLRHAKAI